MSGPPDTKPIIKALPNGETLEFEPGTSPDVVQNVFNREVTKLNAAKPTGGAFGSGIPAAIMAGAGRGASFETVDELGGAIRGVESMLKGGDYEGAYNQALKTARENEKFLASEHPYATFAGQVLGTLLFAAATRRAIPGTQYIADAPNMLNMMGRSAGVAGAYGGAQGFGAGEGGIENRLKSGAAGGAIGAAIGAAIPPVAQAAKGVGSWALNKVTDLFKSPTTITEAAPAATMGVADAAAAPPASVTVNSGQASKAISKIAEALRRDGFTPAQVQQVLDKLGPDATLADLGENTRGLLTAAMSAPGAGKQIGKTLLENRQAGEQGALLESAANVFKGAGAKGFHETDDALLAALEKEASPLYTKSFAEAQPVNTAPVLETIDKALAKMPAKSSIRSALEKVRGLLGDTVDDGFKPYDDLEVLHNAKMSIDDMLSKYTGDDSLGNVARAKVMDVKQALLTAMEELNPLYKEARGKFSGIMTSKDALQAGRAFIKEDAEITASALKELDPADQQFFREGAFRAISDIIKSKPQDVSVVQLLRKTGLLEKVKTLAPDEGAFNSFVQELTNVRRFAQTRAATAGSNTTEKILGAMDLAESPVVQMGGNAMTGNKAGVIRSAYDWVKEALGPGEESRAAIVQALLSNDRPAINETLRQTLLAEALRGATNKAAATGAVGASPTGALYGDALLGRRGGPR